jgi:predicted DNA-binding transcriptional regulator AlpA
MSSDTRETTAHQKRRSKKRPESVFVTKAELAHLMGVGDTRTIDEWIAKRGFPPPHSYPGPRHSVWLRKHWDFYVANGCWPNEAFPAHLRRR